MAVAAGAGADAAAAAMAATGVGAPSGGALAAAGTAVAEFGAAGVFIGTGTQILSGIVIGTQTGNWQPLAGAVLPVILNPILPVGQTLEGPVDDAASSSVGGDPPSQCP